MEKSESDTAMIGMILLVLKATVAEMPEPEKVRWRFTALSEALIRKLEQSHPSSAPVLLKARDQLIQKLDW